eukprot:TRINITY_DN19155_c0_g1_i1.p1 TRINITY_DN19155_c0_g1~~TRINITY_DN19155_c0_g1_i1.p1  ORF type:complete len:110 (+),score=18.23 TRINITY_DN19155_c0_g1_i1:19-348(+)
METTHARTYITKLVTPLHAAAMGQQVLDRVSASGRIFLQKIHPELYSDISLLLIFIGVVMALHFVYYEVAMLKRPLERRLFPQLVIAITASFFLGLGFFFLYAWARVYA